MSSSKPLYLDQQPSAHFFTTIFLVTYFTCSCFSIHVSSLIGWNKAWDSTTQSSSSKGPRRFDLARERESHRCRRSECRSVRRHCFAQNSRDPRDARKHERVRSDLRRIHEKCFAFLALEDEESSPPHLQCLPRLCTLICSSLGTQLHVLLGTVPTLPL